MEFLSQMMGLALFLVCLLLVFLFMKDFIRLGAAGAGGKKRKAPRSEDEAIRYRIFCSGAEVGSGTVDACRMPVQFGRVHGFGNDVCMEDYDIPGEILETLSRAWFYIGKDASGQVTFYSADPSDGSVKRASADRKLTVAGEEDRPRRAIRLEKELVLKVGRLHIRFLRTW